MIGYNTFVKLAVITALQVAVSYGSAIKYSGPLKY